MSELLVRMRNVGLRYPGRGGFISSRIAPFWALRDVSLDLHRGEALGVIGRNGAGKSTLLKILAGIYRPDRGSIDRFTSSASLLSFQVGFIPYLTGRENALLSGMLLGLPKKEVQKRLESIIRFAELEEFIDRPLATYSDGMRARLGFAVSYQIDPEILLIDEVFSVGDAHFREKSAEAMQQRIRSERTVVLVSHSPATIKSLCNRAVWVERGVSRAEGDCGRVLDLYQRHLREGEPGDG